MTHPLLDAQVATVFTMGRVDGDFGVELELEGENLPQPPQGWSRKLEGSLRGKGGRTIHGSEEASDTPYEYILRQPCSFSVLNTRLNTLYKALSSKEVTVSLTDRASTHIHLNFTNETMRTMLGFLVAFTIIEPVLLRQCGAKRNGNLFCLPSYETGELPNFLSRVLPSLGSSGAFRKSWHTRGKYAALNTDPLVTFGSLEARCFPNTIDPELILKWASWLLALRTLASTWKEKDFFSLVERAYNNPAWMLNTVFGDEGRLFSNCYPTNPNDLIAFGAEHAYEVARSMEPVFNHKPSGKRGRRLSSEDLIGLVGGGQAQWPTIPVPPAPISWEDNPLGWNEPVFAEED